MKKTLLISLLLYLAICGVQAQLTRYSMHKEYSEVAKIEVATSNIMAILFLIPKPSWPDQIKQKMTPFVVVPTVGITIVKGFEYNYHALAARAPKWFIRQYGPRVRFENNVKLLRQN